MAIEITSTAGYRQVLPASASLGEHIETVWPGATWDVQEQRVLYRGRVLATYRFIPSTINTWRAHRDADYAQAVAVLLGYSDPEPTNHAETLARVTGSRSATVRYEHVEPGGTVVLDHEQNWYRDDAMNLRCNSCEHLVSQCIC